MWLFVEIAAFWIVCLANDYENHIERFHIPISIHPKLQIDVSFNKIFKVLQNPMENLAALFPRGDPRMETQTTKKIKIKK